ncbi:four helix bundle protein [Longitalea luteola]|uniref:four helix bundle protein n=1 Tax=Longitalea luteola TaxID=2812563 RepID=UPI001A969DA8|nr:four helix bundle protein [Longitalea luteola]
MKKELLDQNVILKLSLDFSLMLIAYCEELDALRKFVISKQLLRSGTSIGANTVEAQNAESKADFIHKMKLAAKEAEETQYWLMLCEYSQNFPECKALVLKLEQIQRVLAKILSTSKKNNRIAQ